MNRMHQAMNQCLFLELVNDIIASKPFLEKSLEIEKNMCPPLGHRLLEQNTM